MGKLTLFLDNIAEWTCKIFKWGLGLLMILIVLEVTLRYAFNAPTLWSLDIQTQVFGTCMLIGMAYTLLKKGHVTVDIVTVRLPTRTKSIVDAIGYCIWLFPMVLSQTYTWFLNMQKSWRVQEKSTSPWMPPVYQFKTLLFLLLLYFYYKPLVSLLK
jgi:TRAP-type mannitol/chloroaromatic compound transport system permease small subunit